MDYLELSLKNVEDYSRILAQTISNSFRPEIVIFISKGSFPIGLEISRYFDVPLYEIYAERQGGNLKILFSPILKILPKWVKQFLRKSEVKSGVHNKRSERKVYMGNHIPDFKGINNILIVDDSVDTGYTAKEVYNYVNSKFPSRNIKFAAFNFFTDSNKIFQIDFSIFENCIILGPWSKDSKEYSIFNNEYMNWKQSLQIKQKARKTFN